MSDVFYQYLLQLKEYTEKQKFKGTLGITLNQFEENWSLKASKRNFEYKIIEVIKKNNIVNINLKGYNHVAFIGRLIEANQKMILKNISMFMSGDGNISTGVNNITALLTLIDVLNPSKDYQFAKNILFDLSFDELKEGNSNFYIKNDYKYTVRKTKTFGINVTIAHL